MRRGSGGRPRVGTGAKVLLREGISCEGKNTTENRDVDPGEMWGGETGSRIWRRGKTPTTYIGVNNPNINFRMSFTAIYGFRIQIISDSKKASTNGETT